jgi:probable HAF family extracellular repeat protein
VEFRKSRSDIAASADTRGQAVEVVCMRRMNLFFAGLVLVLGLVAVAFSGGKAQAEATWAITDLGTLGGLSSLANEINERGQVIGTAETTSIYEEGDEKGNPARHAFLWENSEMRDLGTLGGPSSTPSDINNRGQIVGWADTKLWDPYFDQVRHAFLWQNGKMRDLGTLGGRWSRAVDMNERGQVVGWADTKTLDSDGEQITHAFLWEKGKMRDLGAIGKESSRAVAINERGQVIGTNGTIHDDAFLWEKGKMRDLGTLGGRRATRRRSTSVARSSGGPKRGPCGATATTSRCMRSCGRTGGCATCAYSAGGTTGLGTSTSEGRS